MYTLTICFIGLNVSIQFVLIFRPHPVYVEALLGDGKMRPVRDLFLKENTTIDSPLLPVIRIIESPRHNH